MSTSFAELAAVVEHFLDAFVLREAGAEERLRELLEGPSAFMKVDWKPRAAAEAVGAQ